MTKLVKLNIIVFMYAVAALAIDKVGSALPFLFGPYLGPYLSARKQKK